MNTASETTALVPASSASAWHTKLYWLLRRELWQHARGLLWSPAIVGLSIAILTLMGSISAIIWGGKVNGLDISTDLDDLAQHSGKHEEIIQGMSMVFDSSMYAVAAICCVTAGFVIAFYCLGALYEERKDRSVLLWKSLPVSDSLTVLSKVITACVIAPTLAVLSGIVAGWLSVLAMIVPALFVDGAASLMLQAVSPFAFAGRMLAFLPLTFIASICGVGWLLLVSSWSKSRPFLKGIVYPLLVPLAVAWVFSIMGLKVSFLGDLYQFFFGALATLVPNITMLPTNITELIGNINSPHQLFNTAQFSSVLGQWELWLGVVIGLVCMAGAVWFRGKRTEI